MTTTTFTGMHTVAVPVTDQHRTKALFEQFGLQTRLDTELQPGFRWFSGHIVQLLSDPVADSTGIPC